MARFGSLARSGRYNVPVGLLNAGKRFSPEMALVGLEIERWIVESGRGIEVSPETLRVEQIRKVGIGGHSMGEDHTREFMRRNIWYPQLMDRNMSSDIAQESSREMIETAARKVREVLERKDLYLAEGAMARAIDQVEQAAARELTS
jgi:trimethylamine--corrinoid protein Co-methyltransferase